MGGRLRTHTIMTGYITSPAVAEEILEAIRQGFLDQNMRNFWSPGAYPMGSGEHQGLIFIPLSDENLDQQLSKESGTLTPAELPSVIQIINDLGGLAARINIDPSDLNQ